MELVEFLEARIAEDEAVVAEYVEKWGPLGDRGWSGWTLLVDDEYASMLIEPRRVLAECESRRRIVAWHRLIDGLDTEDHPVRGCGNCIASGAEPPYVIAGPCMTLRLLALPYASHPDYQQEWKP